MAFLSRIFAPAAVGRRTALRPLYDQVVAAARRPIWYREGRVPDTVTGRFDMLATVLALVLVRMERETDAAADAVALTELFIDDMDGSIRELGFGDLGVGKQVGKLVALLGGRLGLLRGIGAMDDAALDDALARNLYRGDAPDAAALDSVRVALRELDAAIGATGYERLRAGEGGW